MPDCKKGNSSFSAVSKTGSLLYTYRQLRTQDFEFIDSLPIYDMIELNGIPFEIAHTANNDDRYYFDGMDNRIQTVFGQMKCRYLLTGHAHKQYIRHSDGKTIINPGPMVFLLSM